MALHVHGSTNPLGINNNIDRLPFHGYFVFKDLVTVFLLLLIFSLFVFFSPNTMGQKWPILNIMYIYLIINYAICWNYLYFLKKINYNKTNIISDLINNANPKLVRYYYNKYNQQITNIIYFIYLYIKINILVGISETTRIHKNIINNRTISTINNNSSGPFTTDIVVKGARGDIKFNQWLAGLIDGDGYFNISKKKYTSCEIIVGIEDEKMLYKIQNKFGGSINLKLNIKVIKWRLHNKKGMINLINAINGNIRNSKRLIELEKICLILNINCIKPIPLDINNSWFTGLFDANGSINYYYDNNKPKLFISVTNKYLNDIKYFINILGGNIYFEKSNNGYYKWIIINEIDHMNFYNYILNNPSKSNKNNFLFLLKNYYYLYNNKAYIKNNTLLYKSWLLFETKWKNINKKI